MSFDENVKSNELTLTENPPLFSSKISAGFPSPADDYAENALNLNSYLIKNPPATFFARVEGNSMQMINSENSHYKRGINQNDLLIIDRSLTARNCDVVVAILNGEFTVKRLFINGSTVELKADNPNYPNIRIKEDMDFEVWGVVTYVIHSTKDSYSCYVRNKEAS